MARLNGKHFALTDEMRWEIIGLYEQRAGTQREIAAAYGVSTSTISKIIRLWADEQYSTVEPVTAEELLGVSTGRFPSAVPNSSDIPQSPTDHLSSIGVSDL